MQWADIAYWPGILQFGCAYQLYEKVFFEVLYIGPSNINLLLSNIKVLFFSTYMST